MKAHLIDTHLLVPRSRSSAKVKVKYQDHVSQKIGASGVLVFHKHILFLLRIFTEIEVPTAYCWHVNVVLLFVFQITVSFLTDSSATGPDVNEIIINKNSTVQNCLQSILTLANITGNPVLSRLKSERREF